MNILVSGTQSQLKEFERNFCGSNVSPKPIEENNYTFISGVLVEKDFHSSPDAVFDLDFDDEISRFNMYQGKKDVVFFLSSVKIALGGILNVFQGYSCIPYGMNALPGFIKKNLLEISVPDARCENKLNEMSRLLGFSYKKVKDQAGMVTPRVICMIINEAYFMMEEQTATSSDIDKAMKLGTNYPFGPFEWAEIIGKKNVCEILEAVYRETGDEKYKVCSDLKKDASCI